MKLDDELDREQDIEELRRLARALHAQNQQLMAALTAKSREVERLRGKPGDLQLTLKMLEMLQAKAKAADEALAKAEEAQKRRKAEEGRAAKERTRSGPTPQPNLPVVERVFPLEEADRASKARLAAARSGWVQAWASATGVICHEMPHLSRHQPHSTSWPPWPTMAFQ